MKRGRITFNDNEKDELLNEYVFGLTPSQVTKRKKNSKLPSDFMLKVLKHKLSLANSLYQKKLIGFQIYEHFPKQIGWFFENCGFSESLLYKDILEKNWHSYSAETILQIANSLRQQVVIDIPSKDIIANCVRRERLFLHPNIGFTGKTWVAILKKITWNTQLDLLFSTVDFSTVKGFPIDKRLSLPLKLNWMKGW